MGELRLPGLATGIDTTTLIAQLMIINSRRLANYQTQKMGYEAKSSALDELRTVIAALSSSVSALSDADNLQAFTASSSDTDVLTVGASSDAFPGSHSVQINQLATTETWIHDVSTFGYETDYVGEGDFIYSYNNQERVITTTAETTLEGLVDLINNDNDNPGVTASLLYQGGKYHLMLSGQETGEDYQISINESTTEVWESSTEGGSFTEDGEVAALSTKIIELDEFEVNGGLQGDEFIRISGKNHAGTDIPDLELDITANTTVGHIIDAINEHFDGVATAVFENGQIQLTANPCGSSDMEISLAYDPGTGDTDLTLPTMDFSTEGGSIAADLTGFEYDTFIETQNAQSSKIKIDNYPSASSIAAEIQTLTVDQNATGGHFHLMYNGQTTAEIANNATAETIQNALEALSNVEAGDITVTGIRLSQGGPLTFEFLQAAGDVSMISIDATALVGPTTCSFTETTKGNDGWLTRNSNSISDALPGITLNLHDVTDDPIEITLSRDTSAVSSKVEAMVNNYNIVIGLLEERTEYNAETKQMGILSTNMGVAFIESQLRAPFIGIVDGFTDAIDSFVQASDIGITFAGDGTMELDLSELEDAIEDDFTGVLELLGAVATGSDDGGVVEFYSASGNYTTAGTYNVKVTIAAGAGGNEITGAYIKLAGESMYRACTWDGNLIIGDSTFDDDGSGPLYPENSLYLTVDLTDTGVFGTDEEPLIVRVKQGFAGALDDILDGILELDGRIDVSEGILEDKITQMETTIEREENRLTNVETRLIAKYARLEKTLVLLQQQLGAISIFSMGSG